MGSQLTMRASLAATSDRFKKIIITHYNNYYVLRAAGVPISPLSRIRDEDKEI